MTEPSVPETAPRRRGRRRSGSGDARAQIVRAATKEFLDHGYDRASIRAIARRAEVDPALVHHYFNTKADLFGEAVSTPIRPDKIVAEVLRGPREDVGVSLVMTVLTLLEARGARDRIISLMRTALGHDFAAAMLRQFLEREVIGRIADELDAEDGRMRATAAAAQLVGLFMARYGVRLEPMASASIEEVAARIGPAIQWHLTGFPGPLDSGAHSAE